MITTLIVTTIVAIALLAYACETVGYWKIEALEGRAHIRRLEQKLARAYAALADARAEIDDDNVIIAGLHKQVGGHIKDNSALLILNKYLEGGAVVAELLPGEMSDAVEEWLAETVTP